MTPKLALGYAGGGAAVLVLALVPWIVSDFNPALAILIVIGAIVGGGIFGAVLGAATGAVATLSRSVGAAVAWNAVLATLISLAGVLSLSYLGFLATLPVAVGVGMVVAASTASAGAAWLVLRGPLQRQAAAAGSTDQAGSTGQTPPVDASRPTDQKMPPDGISSAEESRPVDRTTSAR